ncbi:hypothetical protein KY359_01190 [Candidatus Woesearchaeota archaeon]|nr:hypothetical protein [Candidatus Woesearchaeota archaeon]
MYSCRGWKKPVSAKIDLEGEEEVARSIASSIVDRLHKKREVYYAEYGGAYNGGESGTVFVRHTLDVIVHEAWHMYVDNVGLSTTEGLAIEEASSLVIDEYATRAYDRIHPHLRASRAFARLYKEISCRRDSKNARENVMRVAKRHAYNGVALQSGDRRVSPWAYLTDDLKYMLLYQLCFDLTRKGIEHARNVYVEALKKVKETGILQEGIEVLKAHATKRVRDLYDFRVEPFDEDMEKVYDHRTEGNVLIPGFPRVEVCGNDRNAVKEMVGAVRNYEKFFREGWTTFINERTSEIRNGAAEGVEDREGQPG